MRDERSVASRAFRGRWLRFGNAALRLHGEAGRARPRGRNEFGPHPSGGGRIAFAGRAQLWWRTEYGGTVRPMRLASSIVCGR